jgi:hypothetical protein
MYALMEVAVGLRQIVVQVHMLARRSHAVQHVIFLVRYF